MKTFLILLLAFTPLFIVLSVFLAIQDKRYQTGTRSVDRFITKTRLIAVNGVEYITHRGAVSNALIGHMLAGDIGALIGAMSAEQIHTDNEFTFLVFYNAQNGNKKETEKVRQTSGRFQFLVSRLEDASEEEQPQSQKAGKPKAIPKPAQRPVRRPQNSEDKTVRVPVGEYIVGEDIPAGAYALSSDKQADIYLYSSAGNDSYISSFSCEEPFFAIGKLMLKEGMKIRISSAAVAFSAYTGLKDRALMENRKPANVLTGEYIVGEDIPAGSYTLTSAEEAVIYIYENEDAKYFDDSYSCDEPDYTVGKITLKNRMRIEIHHAAMTFSPFEGLGF